MSDYCSTSIYLKIVLVLVELKKSILVTFLLYAYQIVDSWIDSNLKNKKDFDCFLIFYSNVQILNSWKTRTWNRTGIWIGKNWSAIVRNRNGKRIQTLNRNENVIESKMILSEILMQMTSMSVILILMTSIFVFFSIFFSIVFSFCKILKMNGTTISIEKTCLILKLTESFQFETLIVLIWKPIGTNFGFQLIFLIIYRF